MNIIKSLHAGVLYKTFDHRNKSYFTVSLLWGFSLDSGTPVLEQKLWELLGKNCRDGAVIDMGMPKARAEYIVYGSFFAENQKPVQAGKVKVTLGPLSKEIYVFGDRQWNRLGISDPVPMIEVPLVYANAFGGDGYEKNPMGKGYCRITSQDETSIPLPNLEYPGQIIGSVKDRPEPAGLGPVDISWQPRAGKSGTYDATYVKERIPGLPDDIDWTFFNQGAYDQWMPGHFTGDESFELLNMSRNTPRIHGRLPGVQGRCFINHNRNDETLFKEIACKLDTVLFFPDENTGCVIHRGTVEVAEDDAADIKQLLLAHENIADAPRPHEHYLNEMACRTDPDEGFKYMMYTAPLLPQGCRCGFELLREESAKASENLMGKNFDTYAKKQVENYKKLAEEKTAQLVEKQEKLIQDLKEAGVDTKPMTEEIDKIKEKMAKAGKTDEPVLSAEAEQLTRLMENILPGITKEGGGPNLSKLNLQGFDDLQAYMVNSADEKKKQILEDVKSKLKEAGEREGYQALKDLRKRHEMKGMNGLDADLDEMFDIDRVIKTIDNLNNGTDQPRSLTPLPRVKLTGQFDDLKERLEKAQDQMQEIREKVVSLDDFKKIKEEIPKDDMKDKRKGVEDLFDTEFSQEKVTELGSRITEMEEPLRQAEQRAKSAYGLTAHLIEGSSSPHEGQEQDIAAKLMAAHKNGSPTANGDYAFVDLSGRDLSGIDLSNCYLEYANLAHTNLTKANLSRAILAHADLTGATLANADLTGANVGAVLIRGTKFINADLTGATLSRSVIEDADFIGCSFGDRQDLFLETKFCRSNFRGSSMKACDFIDMDLTGCCFDSADLAQSNFIHPVLEKTSFKGAVLEGVNFIGAKGENASFRESRMNNVRFLDSCVLANADFSMADAAQSCLRQCDFKNSNFSGACLDRADLGESDLSHSLFNRARAVQAQFIKADLSFAQLHRINLMEGNLMKARLVGASFTQANLYSVSFLKSRVDKNTDFTDAYLEQTMLYEQD
ncbi:DUF2169 domain-containing protein [uncultured Desulfobacter sp.]|uniref:DUF2169 domain-containing protein n=1 Tax=uncultured Desulfobacter sp. TaxID=240139 RepID=UPI002AAB4B9A|nr:DUF2169 domain-containing protein [uncultured Desulfobacter sp.]